MVMTRSHDQALVVRYWLSTKKKKEMVVSHYRLLESLIRHSNNATMVVEQLVRIGDRSYSVPR